MRQKKSNFAYYLIGATIIAAICLVTLMEIPFSVEHIEEIVR